MVWQGFEIIARELVYQDVNAVFGVMGEGNLELIAHLHDETTIDYFAVRHESAAVSMAEGYARVTRRPGVATVTHGPGLANTVTTLTAAVRDRSPLVLLAGDVSSGSQGHVQKIDQRQLLSVTEAEFINVLSVKELAPAMQSAFATAQSHSVPVVVNIPTDVSESACSISEPVGTPVDSEIKLPRLPVDRDALERAADLLSSARLPVVLAGQGAVHARRDLEHLAEASGALLATTLMAKGLFAGNPWNIGIAGGFGSGLAKELLVDSDCVVAFGASLNMWTTGGGRIFPNATVIQCDEKGHAATAAVIPVDLFVHGYAEEFAPLLANQISVAKAGYRTNTVKVAIKESAGATEFEDMSIPGFIDPRSLCLELNRRLPSERNLVVDGGHFMGFPCRYIDVPQASAFMFAVGFGSIGLALASAVGTAIAAPTRLTVAVIGDGGLMMSLPELETAARYGVPLVIVVINDGGYGAEVHHLRSRGRNEEVALFQNPDFADVAMALGASGRTVTSMEDLAFLEGAVESLKGPLLIEARVNREVVADWFAQLSNPHENK